MTMRQRSIVFATLLLMICALPASADVGIPMVSCIHPGFWFLLPFVIILEAVVALIVLRKGVWMALKVAGIANLVSTVVGIPIRWLIELLLTPIGSHFISKYPPHHPSVAQLHVWWNSGSILQKFAMMVTYAPLGLAPDEKTGLVWIRWSWGLLLIPFFVLSVLVERWVALKFVGKDGRKSATIWAWTANAVSYALIFVMFWWLWTVTWSWLEWRGY